MRCIRFVLLLVVCVWAPAHAGDLLEVLEVALDRPTLHALGIQVRIAGDADRDARITVRYRQVGTDTWRDGLPLLRVWPEIVWIAVVEQFAGSVFDLLPGTTYELELNAVDPDGMEWSRRVRATTRPVPRAEPAIPRNIGVATARELQTALAAARPGEVITLAAGMYAGVFALQASGTAENPIIIRGESTAGVILDGQGCGACDVLAVQGSFVHVEDLSIRHAVRALRFSGEGATANVARRLHIFDVVHGIGKAADQTDFYIGDNLIEGRLAWPWVFGADATAHWDDRGVDLAGDGHVVCHNRIVGFGDPIVNKKVGARAWDVYGNDIAECFDGTELDESAGNVRLFRNRWTNVMAPVSVQPMHGGPAYVLRNVAFNIPDEQLKLKSLGGEQLPSGVLIFHNTFVSPHLALNLQSPITQYNFEIANNLFVGPQVLESGRTVDWTTEIAGGVFDHNGYWPDGGFWFGRVNGQNRIWDSFAQVVATGQVERGGVLLVREIFAGGFVGPADATVRYAPPSFVLAAGSNALDTGRILSGINTDFTGEGPDLGALERGCPEPTYGPRARGEEDRFWPIDCGAGSGTPTGVLVPDGAKGARPAVFALYQNVPNPFNPETQIRFDLVEADPVRLAVYDALGQPIRTLVASRLAAGSHLVRWNGRDAADAPVSSGVYFYRLEAGESVQVRRMLLLK